MILDDGFQYWRLHRDLDIVLLDAVEPFGFGYLLPRGLLREPLRHLRRANAVVITQSDRAGPNKVALAKDAVARFAPGRPVWTARYKPVRLTRLGSGAEEPMSRLRGARAAALSSIAVPQSFEDTLSALGVSEVLPFQFPDHYTYTAEDVARVLQHAQSRRADLVVTTEKDAVKLSSLPLSQKEEIWVLSVRMTVDDEEGFAQFAAEALWGTAGER
ncbi:MAG: tetraacyldisaccharide 4'-kinase, partial [Armatimonadota bacterium]